MITGHIKQIVFLHASACIKADVYKRQELLHTEGPNIAEQGLRNVHNDTCYPALLVIGQLMDAIESGRYDIHKIALILPQTGGGCRASNYIHLLRKALEKNGYGFIPVSYTHLDVYKRQQLLPFIP